MDVVWDPPRCETRLIGGRTYTHGIKELAGQTTVSGDDLIRDAKSGRIPVTCKEEIAK